ncbi:BolA family protein [Candidatus Ichthyocystis sparus]|uniref:BolA family protein n=1 Tax=Candidatus Ichthyocystis sparus TaxID=1561004 RepID=UPI000B88C609|nr:BolA/IbaG family iron-sulfur metabolism protein [Candidatus Ichthyocystis sparus]
MIDDHNGDRDFSDILHEIRERLRNAFSPLSLLVERRPHPQHNDGRDQSGIHVYVYIESSVFNGKTKLQSHRLVYSTLDDMIQSKIHSISIKVVPVSV